MKKINVSFDPKDFYIAYAIQGLTIEGHLALIHK